MTNTEQQLRQKVNKLAKDIFNGYLAYGDSISQGIQVFPPSLEQVENAIFALFQSHEAQVKQELFKKVRDEFEAELFNIPPSNDAMEHARRFRSSLKALEEKEIGNR